MLWAFVIAAVIAGAVFYWLHRATSGGGRFTNEAALRSRLRRKVMGNDGAVERLLEVERRRRPEASESELLRAAIDRLDRDRR